MAFDDLTFRQSELITKLLEAELSGRYESEFHAVCVMGKGWFIQVEGKGGEEDKEFGDFTEGDLVELGTSHYLTAIQKQSGFAISLSQRAFEQYHLKRGTSESARPEGVTTAHTSNKESIDIFISHSARDKAVAEALINLLKASLNIPADRIRCTSVDGYRLPIGATTDEQLRQEIYEAKFFLGLITPTSLQSTYVLFELGARWGAGLHLAPLLASGATAAALRAPLSGLNSISCEEPAQIYQLLRETASILEMQLDDPSSYQKHIETLVKESKSVREAVAKTSDKNHRNSIFSDSEAKEFQYLAQKLDRKALISIPVNERYGNFWDPIGMDIFNTNLISMILEYLSVGYHYFDFTEFNRRIEQAFCPRGQVRFKSSAQRYGTAKTTEDVTQELQKYGLVLFRRMESENNYEIVYEFTEKVHRLRYWLEITGYNVEAVSFEYVENKPRLR